MLYNLHLFVYYTLFHKLNSSGRSFVRVQFSFYLLFVFSLTFYGCSSVRINSDFDPAADFSSIHTYSWKKVHIQGDALAANPLLYKSIAKAIDRYLQARGFQETDRMTADVLVAIHAGVKEKMRMTQMGHGTRAYYSDPWKRPLRGRGGPYGSRVDVSYYTEGTLIIDIVERKKQELIWRGLGTGIVHATSNQKKKSRAIDEYVRRILDQFPPGHKVK